jgi:hypothetical protein
VFLGLFLRFSGWKSPRFRVTGCVIPGTFWDLTPGRSFLDLVNNERIKFTTMNSKITILFLLFLLVGFTQSTFGQCVNSYYDFLDINKVNAQMHNGPDHFWDFVQNSRYEVPKGSGKTAAFASSLWIGGLDESNGLHVAANNYRQVGVDFYAGPYRDGGNYTCDRGFASPSMTFDHGLMTLSGGKVLSLYSNGFTVYDPGSGNVVNRVLPVLRTLYQGVELPDGRVLLFGDDSYPVKSPPLMIDTAGFTIAQIPLLNHWHKRSTTTRLGNGQILLAGIDGCEIFDPATTTSASVAAMNNPRLGHAAALLNNGKVLIAGGSTSLGATGFMSGTELYDPAANTWTAGPLMNVGRNKPSATALANGDILITGGSNSQTDFSLYNPASNTFSPVPGGPYAFNVNNTTTLSNGKLLIAHDDVMSYGPVIALYDPVTYASENVQLTFAGSHLTSIAGGLVMIERANNRFAQFDPLAKRLIDQPWQYMWRLNRSQINQFIADQANNQVNFANYPDIETWPATGDTSLGEDGHLAPFVDVNLDGKYRPMQDGDYPCFEGDQAMWWVYNDDGPHTQTNADQFGLQVEQMAYAYDCGSTPCTTDSFLDYATFHHLEITNKSETNYRQVYVGVWLDVDIGYFADDYVGSDSLLGMGFGYNGDAVDETAAGYGVNPPALGVLFLDNGQIGRSTNVMYYENDFTILGNPTAPEHYYNYLRSIWPDGSPLTYGGNGYQTGNPTEFIYSGDPGFCGGPGSGWSEVSVANTPFDRRMLQSFGPFDLDAGEEIDFDYTILWTRGYYNDNLGSVCELKKAAVVVDSFWQAQPKDCFAFVVNRDESVRPAVEAELYPNPNQGQFVLRFEEVLGTEALLQVYDLAGRVVYVENLPAQQTNYKISTGSLSGGVYLIRVHNEQMALTRKMVVRH